MKLQTIKQVQDKKGLILNQLNLKIKSAIYDT